MASSNPKPLSSSALKPAAELARASGVRFPTRAPNIAVPVKRCWPRRSSFAATSSAWPSSAVPCRRVARSKRITPSRAKQDRRRSPICSATRIRSLSTTTCSARSVNGRARLCTSLLSAWDGEVPDVQQRVALAVVARSPIQRLVAFKKERGWHYLPLFSDISGEFSRDYHALTKDGGDDAAFNVFTRRQGKIRHFWGGEMNGASADPGQDPRGAPDLMPLWTILDVTPAGRGRTGIRS